MEVVPERSGERSSKRARLDAPPEDGRQADIAAPLPSYPAGQGALTTGSHEMMHLHDGRQRLTDAAAHSAGGVRGGMQSDLAHIPLQEDRDAEAAGDKESQQQQQQQQKLPSSVLSKQGDAAHELPAARTAKELPTANGMQQGANSGSSIEAETSSEEDSLPGRVPTSPTANAQDHPLAGQQQQQKGTSQPGAHGLVKPGEAHSSSGSEEESGLSSEEHDVQPDSQLSNPARLLPAPTQEAQDLVPRYDAAHSPGREEEGSSSQDDSPSDSGTPVAQQHPAPDSPVQAQQTGQQQAGLTGKVQNDNSTGEVDRESPEKEGRAEAPPAQDSKQAARDQAKQGALGAEKCSSSGSEEEGRGTSDLARRPDSQPEHELALLSGRRAAGPNLAQQPDGKAPAHQRQVPNKAAPTQLGPWGVAAQDEGSSSSSEEGESSDPERPPHAAASLRQIDSTEQQPPAQAASHRAGSGDGAAPQGQFTPVAHRTRQGARAGHEAEGHVPANGGKSAAHVDGSASESEEDSTPRCRSLRALTCCHAAHDEWKGLRVSATEAQPCWKCLLRAPSFKDLLAHNPVRLSRAYCSSCWCYIY